MQMDNTIPQEKNKKVKSRSFFSILMVCIIGINVISFVSLLILCYRRFMFPHFKMDSTIILLFATALSPTFFAVIGYFVCRKTKGKVRNVISTISIAIIEIAMVPACLAGGLLNIINPWSSQTDNSSNHYLLVDGWVGYDSSVLKYLDDIIELRIDYEVYGSSYVKAILFFEDTNRIAYTFSYAQDNGSGFIKPYYVEKYPELAVNFKRL